MGGFAALSAVVAVAAVLPLLAQGGPWLFDYSASASTGIIEATVLSGLSGKTTEYRVFGDGRVKISVFGPGRDRGVLESAEGYLEAAELRALVRDLVESGVARLDVRALRDGHRQRGERTPGVSDGQDMTFELHLDYLAEGSRNAEEPFSHRFTISNPRALALFLPNQPEYASLKRFLERVNQIYLENRTGRR